MSKPVQIPPSSKLNVSKTSQVLNSSRVLNTSKVLNSPNSSKEVSLSVFGNSDASKVLSSSNAVDSIDPINVSLSSNSKISKAAYISLVSNTLKITQSSKISHS